MNVLRVLLVAAILFGGLGLSTAAFAGPISVEYPHIVIADSSPEPTKTPKPTPTPGTDDEANIKIAEAIAKYFDVPVDEVMAWHDAGNGWGGIVKAYALAEASGLTVDEIFDMRMQEQGWGVIVKELAVGKWKTNLGQVMRDDKDKNDSDAPGNSGGNRNDDKDKGKSDDKGKPDNVGKPDDKGKSDNKGRNK